MLENDIKIENNTTISGYCKTKGWVTKKYFFTIHFDTPFSVIQELPKGKKQNAPQFKIDFDLADEQIVLLNNQQELLVELDMGFICKNGKNLDKELKLLIYKRNELQFGAEFFLKK